MRPTADRTEPCASSSGRCHMPLERAMPKSCLHLALEVSSSEIRPRNERIGPCLPLLPLSRRCRIPRREINTCRHPRASFPARIYKQGQLASPEVSLACNSEEHPSGSTRRRYQRTRDRMRAKPRPDALATCTGSGTPVRGHRIADRLQAGHIWLNTPQIVCPDAGWGGYKASDVGYCLEP